MVANPSLYGFSRTGAGDLGIADPGCATDPRFAARWVHWDAAHKTTRVHELMARGLIEQFALPVAAPGGLALLLPGLAALAVMRRRSFARAA